MKDRLMNGRQFSRYLKLKRRGKKKNYKKERRALKTSEVYLKGLCREGGVPGREEGEWGRSNT